MSDLFPPRAAPIRVLVVDDSAVVREVLVSLLESDTAITGVGQAANGAEAVDMVEQFPYDVVFILNRYFEAVGGAVAQAGGIANQYTGDGVMALFGVDAKPEAACRQALLAAAAMVRRIEDLSRVLAGELPAPLRIGIGIHTGPVVVGEMGYRDTHYLTAVGDTVNTASRLEVSRTAQISPVV